MRFILKTSIYIILLSVIGLGYFIARTQSGLEFALYGVEKFTPGTLSIQQAEGKLVSHFTLHDISYQNSEMTIHIQSLDFSWNPIGFLLDKFVIEKIVLDNTQIKLNPSSSSGSSDFQMGWLHYIVIKEFIANHLLIQNGDALIELDGALRNNWNATWKARIPNLTTFIPNASGSVNSSGKITGKQFSPSIFANLQAEHLVYDQHKIEKLTGKINFDLQAQKHSTLSLLASGIKINNDSLPKFNADLTGEIFQKQDALFANFDLTLLQQHKIAAHLSLPKFTRLDDLLQPIAGNVAFTSTHLEVLTHFITDIKNPNGTLHGNFLLSGTLGQPLVNADITLKQGQFSIPSLGIKFDKINLHAKNNQTKLINYDGTFQSGSGTGKLLGTLDLAQPDFPAKLVLQGSNLQVCNLSEYKISASPDLHVNLSKNIFQITGNVVIPNADITPKTYSNTITLPSDVVFEDKPDATASLPTLNADMQINLQLGDKIRVVYDDLRTDLSGHLRVEQSPNQEMTATGELHSIKGTYKAFGQVLAIQEGRLLFTGGSVMNPGLNIRASKQIKTMEVGGSSSFTQNTAIPSSSLTPIYTGTQASTVGVQITGTFDKPIVSLFSNPAGLSQNDILSYLLFGFPQSQGSSQQKRMALSAASALNFGGKMQLDSVTSKLQNTLGLSEMNVESAEIYDPHSGKVSSTTAFVVGKQILPDFYAHYSVGLFDPLSVLNLRYQLSKRFAIQSETSNIDKGADLLYSIERE